MLWSINSGYRKSMKKSWGCQAQKRASPRCQPRLCRDELRVKLVKVKIGSWKRFRNWKWIKNRLFPLIQDRKRKRDDKKDKSVGHVEVIGSYEIIFGIRHSQAKRQTYFCESGMCLKSKGYISYCILPFALHTWQCDATWHLEGSDCGFFHVFVCIEQSWVGGISWIISCDIISSIFIYLSFVSDSIIFFWFGTLALPGRRKTWKTVGHAETASVNASIVEIEEIEGNATEEIAEIEEIEEIVIEKIGRGGANKDTFIQILDW